MKIKFNSDDEETLELCCILTVTRLLQVFLGDCLFKLAGSGKIVGI